MVTLERFEGKEATLNGVDYIQLNLWVNDNGEKLAYSIKVEAGIELKEIKAGFVQLGKMIDRASYKDEKVPDNETREQWIDRIDARDTQPLNCMPSKAIALGFKEIRA